MSIGTTYAEEVQLNARPESSARGARRVMAKKKESTRSSRASESGFLSRREGGRTARRATAPGDMSAKPGREGRDWETGLAASKGRLSHRVAWLGLL